MNEVKGAFYISHRKPKTKKDLASSTQDNVRLFFICSFWNQNMAIFTVKIVRPDGRVLTCGAFLELTR